MLFDCASPGLNPLDCIGVQLQVTKGHGYGATNESGSVTRVVFWENVGWSMVWSSRASTSVKPFEVAGVRKLYATRIGQNWKGNSHI